MNYLILINKDNPVENIDDSDFLNIVNKRLFNEDKTNQWFSIERETYQAFLDLQENARRLGYDIEIDDGYRSIKEQQDLKEKFQKLNKGDLVAEPGTSEHHSGLSIDIVIFRNNELEDEDKRERYDTLEEIIWLNNNCHKYGFIIRYPKGKEEITKYSYEPWHIRYVGKEAALYMHLFHETLEEFHEKLNKKQRIR